MNLEDIVKNLAMDEYDLKARFFPALILIAPVLCLVNSFLSIETSNIEAVGSSILILCGAYFLTQFMRDRGKEKEPELFKRWGGMPSVSIFRHVDNRLDRITKSKYHLQLSEMVKGTIAPTAEQEKSDPAFAHEVYTAWSSYLRTNTRGEDFPLVRKELINYGFRRNVYGMRTVGILVSLICLMISVIWFCLVYNSTSRIDETSIIVGGVSSAFFALWIFQFTPDWVRVTANAYAERLVESVEILVTKSNERQ